MAAHPEQGWSLLCNALVVFDDTGELLPDGRCTRFEESPAAQRPSEPPALELPGSRRAW
ncbi:DUF5999 family protein [Streptomyces sp. NPDC092046]|uniref:DUF5999 family protein n=1 Tax=Streptomyces sp. NPDC092046 TaxID=3366009 RepID=UPI00382B7601